MIELEGLHKTYHSKGGTDCQALCDISLTFEDKGLVFLTGKSGSGKSTLLNLIGGLDKFDSGDIKINGSSTKDFNQNDFDDYRNNLVGFIFQDFSLIDSLNVRDNLKIVFSLQNSKASDARISECLGQVGLEGYETRNISELSGGQKQRIAIARALLKNPKILLADEPTGALDYETGQQIYNLFTSLSKEILVIVVSHDTQNVFKFADRIIELKDGRLVSDRSKSQSFCYDDMRKQFEDEVDSYYTATQASNKQNTPLDMGKSKLSLSQTFKTAIHNMAARKFRLVLTILLSVVILTLFGVLFSFSTYNKVESALKSFDQFDIDTLELRMIDEENTRLGDIVHKPFTFEQFLEIQADYPSAIKSVGREVRVGNFRLYSVAELSASTDEALADLYGASLIIGELPESKGEKLGGNAIVEVLISDYAADNLLTRRVSFRNGVVAAHSGYDKLLGKQFDDNYFIYKIVGIFASGYQQFSGSEQDSSQYRYLRYYFYSQLVTATDAVFDGCLLNLCLGSRVFLGRGGQMLDMGNSTVFLSEYGDDSYQNFFLTYYDYAAVDGFDPAAKLGDNQAIVSLSYVAEVYQALGLPAPESVDEVDFSLLADFDVTYASESYPKSISGMQVVAVFSGGAEDNTYGIIINPDNYAACVRQILSINMIKLPVFEDNGQNKQLLEYLSGKSIDFYTYISRELKIFEQINYFLGDFLWAICIVVFIFASLLFYSFISGNISAKKKDIGILRAIGAKGRDISKIFLIEGAILGAINFVISSVLTVFGVNILNKSLTKFIEHKLRVIELNVWSIVIILLLNFSIIIVSSLLSVRHLTRQKPIDVIKNAQN